MRKADLITGRPLKSQLRIANGATTASSTFWTQERYLVLNNNVIMRRVGGVPNKIDTRPIKVKPKAGPDEEIANATLFKNRQKSHYQIFIGTACTGLVRIEWALARWNQVTPCNFGNTGMVTPIPSCSPLGYITADAQNVIVKEFLRHNSEWLWLLEEDTIPPQDTFIKFGKYIRSMKYPVVSGLYFTKSIPAEPMVYRGRCDGYFDGWKMGDVVPVDGVPTGCVIIHRSILEAMYHDSPEYMAGSTPARRVFSNPTGVWHDPEQGWQIHTGTSDLEWCARVITEGYLEKAGWKKLAKQQYPFLVDTNIFCRHINQDGIQFPSDQELQEWANKKGLASDRPRKKAKA